MDFGHCRPAPGRFINLAYSPVTGFQGTFLDATPGLTYRLQGSTSLAADSWIPLATFLYSGPVDFIDATATGAQNKFYRRVTP